MTTFNYRTDAETGTVQSQSLRDAFEKMLPTDAQLADGAWLWVEDPATGERLDSREECK